MLGVMAACSSDDDESGSGFVPQPSERTVIVYMAGENNLTAYVNTNLREMKEGSLQLSPSSCLLVYVDKSKNSELPWLARIRDGQVTDSVSLHDMGISDNYFILNTNLTEYRGYLPFYKAFTIICGYTYRYHLNF